MQREVPLKSVVASFFACVVLAHSTPLFAQAAVPPTGAPAPAAASRATPKPAAKADDATASQPPPDAEAPPQDAEDDLEQAPAATTKPDVGIGLLEEGLRKVEAERQAYSRFWPWFTLTAGTALTVGGVAAGAAHVYGCDGGCSTSAWVGIVVVTGTLVATLGTIWVVRANADVREIDSRRYHLEQEMERIRISANLPNAFDYQVNNASVVSWRFKL
jgi:hypothetical protein